MSKRNDREKEQNTKTNEPWEQPIYDVENEDETTRSSRHQQKRGSTLFLSIVLFILFLCVLVPSLAGIWVYNQKKTAEQAVSIESSTSSVVSESKSESTKESEAPSEEASTESQVVPSTESSTTPESTSSSSSAPEEGQGGTIKVLAGEGPSQIARRAGISVQQLLQLNGMTLQNFNFYPGQDVKIK